MAHTFTTIEHEDMAYRIAIYSQRLNLLGITPSRIPGFLILSGTASILRSRLVLGLYGIFNSHLLLESVPVCGQTHTVLNEKNSFIS